MSNVVYYLILNHIKIFLNGVPFQLITAWKHIHVQLNLDHVGPLILTSFLSRQFRLYGF